MAELVFASELAEPATINIGGTLYPTSILVERRKDDGSINEGEAERIDNLQKVVLYFDTIIKSLQTDSGKAITQLASQIDFNTKIENDIVDLHSRLDTVESEASRAATLISELGDYDMSGDDEEDDEQFEEITDNEQPVALKDILRLVEHSAKAINYMNEHQFSTVWSPCSSNTYGFFIRNVLLCGSSFKRQLIPDTFDLMAISMLGVVFAAGMQFMLAWYLWVNLPPVYPLVTGNGNILKPYPGASQTDENGSYVSGRGYFQAQNGFCVAPDCLTAPLPAYQFPDYSAANDVCRTQSIVQIICIGLFLFSVLTNIPGIIKNVLIIIWSERFLSEDEEDITKIHYWRESDFSREPQADFLNQPQTLRSLPNSNSGSVGSGQHIQQHQNPNTQSTREIQIAQVHSLCNFFRTEKYNEDKLEGKPVNPIYLRSVMLDTFYLPLRDFGKPGMVKWIESVGSSLASSFGRCLKEKEENELNNPLDLSELPRSFYEIADTRQFLSEILQDLSEENRDIKYFWDKDEGNSKKFTRAHQAYAECVKFNLVRADYLKPNFWTRPFAHNSLRLSKDKEATIDLSDKNSAEAYTQLKELKELKDRKNVMNLYTNYPARMRRFRLLAFLFGVIPEVITLIVVTFAGVQYILWSGFKVASDSRGMEEIILATLAICFVYDIDETLYDHVLPEIYKTAHERDRFELRGWISTSRPTSVAEAQSISFYWKILSFQTRYVFHALFPERVRRPYLDMVAVLTSDQKHNLGSEATPLTASSATPLTSEQKQRLALEKKEMDSALQKAPRLRRGLNANGSLDQVDAAKVASMVGNFADKMKITVTRAMKMSASPKYNDLYLARQYPFFYARKFYSHFTSHLGEGFLVWYGHLGLHFLILLAMALSIVGVYRAGARCDRYTSSSSIWSTQEWPSTCVMNVASQPAGKFKDLRGREADLLMPVSCGLTGYLPREAEWKANMDFFLNKR